MLEKELTNVKNVNVNCEILNYFFGKKYEVLNKEIICKYYLCQQVHCQLTRKRS